MIRRGEYNFEISKILVHSNLENFARPLMHRFFFAFNFLLNFFINTITSLFAKLA